MKKFTSILAVCALMISLLAGCMNGEDQSTTTEGTDNPDENEIIELTYWDGTWAEEITPELVKEFEEKNPNIKINVEYFPWDGMSDKYLIALKEDNGPDVINIAVDWTTPYAEMGKLQSLNSFIEEEDYDLTDFYEGALETATYKDEVYALPYRSETMALFYNKKLFADAGLDPEQPPQTWDELLEYSKQLTKGDVSGFGLVGQEVNNFNAQLALMIFSNGGNLLNEDKTKAAIDSPEAIEAVQFFVDMYKKHKVTPGSTMENDNTNNRNLFANEKLAMFVSGNYDIEPILQANPDIDFGVALVPKFKQNETQLGGWSVAVTNTAKDAEAAWKFAKFLASPEISPRYSITFSSRKSAADHEKYKSDPRLETFLDALNYAYPLPASPHMGQIKQIMYNHVQAAMIGDKTVEQAMKDSAKEINGILQ